MRRPALTARGGPGLAALALAALALAAGSGRAAAQDAEPSAAAPAARLPVPEKPPIHEFRLGLGASAFGWDEDADAEDGLFAGFDVERDLATWLAARAALSYGTTDFADPDEPAGGLETRVYLPEVSVLLQPRPARFRDGRLVPYAVLGFGSLITDPDSDGARTRSQNAFGYGLGARLRFGGRLGLRGEVQRYLIKLESPFQAITTRQSQSIHNTRIGGSLTYVF